MRREDEAYITDFNNHLCAGLVKSNSGIKSGSVLLHALLWMPRARYGKAKRVCQRIMAQNLAYQVRPSSAFIKAVTTPELIWVIAGNDEIPILETIFITCFQMVSERIFSKN